MKMDDESIAQRRARLAAEIARQRGEFATAYQNLAKPIHYTENAMRGFGFIRQNPWVISTVPAVVSLATTLLGLRKRKPEPKRKLSLRELRERREREESERKPHSMAGHVARWGNRGWKLFKLYRRVRGYLP